ncbi:putative F420-dependent oxidoreductase [Cellulomonas flavigena DSM 20109]|uniref:Putative F420-dependent oxidoreductase n=1 Tax=Cellulomonas flavigena (strain ATCC 482 / DSM 20109 / BCRC 11376 / JCM 18109 / NBRC 3775 / NCIMB 8073 / NRS 134) TaxID=446466 RepID=D5ULP1_CELFN|nr:LLM class flavin-dependent oxidoreductase [Cellulomonas flavigena]ADG75997.1 putative F420-dependent oxidoreductase [Cellulomonas flavigena DSM 20109]
MTDYGHELRFGTFLTPQNADPTGPVDLAVLSEDAGLDLVTFQDHPYQPAFLDTWTLLSWVAARTERVHLAGNVLNVPLRPPAVLARAAASLDLLSGGRVELGLGAGGFWDAIEGMGVPRLTPGQAVDALDEAIAVIRALWDTDGRGPLRVGGEHHRLAGAKRGPAPAHDIGIWVGAYKPRMLRLVGRTADGWLPSLSYLQPGDLARGNTTIDEAATAAGRDPREVRRLLNVNGRFSPTPGDGLDGPPAQWVDELVRYALEDGIGTFVLATDDPRTIRTFAEQVAPAVRDEVAAARAASGTASGPVRSAVALARRVDGIAYDTAPADVPVVEPGDRAYASLRSTYLRRGAPGVVLLPRTTAQVVGALGWAREQRGPLAVRSGGHGISGRSTNDGGVLLDVGPLDEVTVVDEATRRVRLGAGATWGKVAATLAPHGWAISSGDHGGVGVGGLATTGGIGLLGRSYGLTIDHAVAYEVVTADGTVHVVDREREPELFWGLRGAGGNLGVVTWVEIEAAEVPDVVLATMTFDASDPARLVERWGRVVEDAPRQLTSFLHLQAGGGGRQPLAQAMTVWADGDTTSAVAALEELLGAGPVLDQRATLTPYSGVVGPVAKHHDGGAPPVTRSGLLPAMTDAAAADLGRLLGSGEAMLVQLRATGGAGNDVPPDATAYAHRHQRFSVTSFAGRAGRAGLDDAWDRLAHPHMDGLYLSFETDPRPERLADAFPGRTLERLRALKRTYDPDHVFDQNFPIDPRE